MASEPREFDRSAVVTIQGGGIHGLSLVGQLHTLVDKHRIAPVGIAGTSAGAIVATLWWARLSPGAIRDKFAKLADRGELLGLLGPFEPEDDPFEFKDFCELCDDAQEQLEAISADLRPKPTKVLHRVGRTLASPYRFHKRLSAFRSLKRRIKQHVPACGVFSGDGFERTIDGWIRSSEQLRDYIKDVPSNRLLQFRDLRAARLPPLFITATNLSTREIELLNSVQRQYDNVAIARAVRASVGVPFFFRPINVRSAPRDGWFVDGGVISNFPAWIFSHELRRLLIDFPEYLVFVSRPWVHFGLRLGPDATPTDQGVPTGAPVRPPTASEFATSLMGLFTYQARNALESRLASLISRTVQVEQPLDATGGPSNFLKVDEVTGDMVREMFKRGARYAEEKLSALRYDLPSDEEVVPFLVNLVEKALAVFQQPDNSRLKFRSNIFLIYKDKLVIRYSVSMDEDRDRDLQFHYTNGLSGFCYVSRCLQLCNLEKIRQLAAAGKLNREELFGMPQDQHMKVRDDRTWLASVPIFDQYSLYPGGLAAVPAGHNTVSGKHFHQIKPSSDGAVLGVLNLDAALPYSELNLDDDPASHWTDVHIQLILDCMQAAAIRIAEALTTRFGTLSHP